MKYLLMAFLLVASTAWGEVITIDCGENKLTIESSLIHSIATDTNMGKYSSLTVTWADNNHRYLSCPTRAGRDKEFERVSKIIKHQRAR